MHVITKLRTKKSFPRILSLSLVTCLVYVFLILDFLNFRDILLGQLFPVKSVNATTLPPSTQNTVPNSMKLHLRLGPKGSPTQLTPKKSASLLDNIFKNMTVYADTTIGGDLELSWDEHQVQPSERWWDGTPTIYFSGSSFTFTDPSLSQPLSVRQYLKIELIHNDMVTASLDHDCNIYSSNAPCSGNSLIGLKRAVVGDSYQERIHVEAIAPDQQVWLEWPQQCPAPADPAVFICDLTTAGLVAQATAQATPTPIPSPTPASTIPPPTPPQSPSPSPTQVGKDITIDCGKLSIRLLSFTRSTLRLWVVFDLNQNAHPDLVVTNWRFNGQVTSTVNNKKMPYYNFSYPLYDPVPNLTHVESAPENFDAGNTDQTFWVATAGADIQFNTGDYCTLGANGSILGL